MRLSNISLLNTVSVSFRGQSGHSMVAELGEKLVRDNRIVLYQVTILFLFYFVLALFPRLLAPQALRVLRPPLMEVPVKRLR